MLDAFSFSKETHDHHHGQNRFAVIPTPEKLRADSRFTGRGVRIAFLDSGFYPHPDFADRVVSFHDISGIETEFRGITRPESHHWHGTQTVAACAGNGRLSNGVYRGIASEAELILVKVSVNGRISDQSVEAGLRWILDNLADLDIRILNMSLGGDCDIRSSESAINSLIDRIVEKGVCVTVAAGNSADNRPIPPANSPSAITVGGFSDENRFDARGFALYHSSFGFTIDGISKPEIVAPAMYVAAPILPNTEDYDSAEALSMIASAPDYSLPLLLEKLWAAAGLPRYPFYETTDQVRSAVDEILRDRQIVSAHYKHVDGTSFAAPIAASVVAQMIEANHDLSPAAIRNLLVSTAQKLSRFAPARQGFGILNAAEAVARALDEAHFLNSGDYSSPQIGAATISFVFHDDKASDVVLAGDFNGWNDRTHRLRKCADGLWRIKIPRPSAGDYAYKFCVDGSKWVEDPTHGFKATDGFGGLNSILTVS